MGMNIGSRPRSPSVDRTKGRRLAVGAAFTMLEAGKQGSKVAPEPGGAGTRPQPPRAVPAPGHRLGRASPPTESLLVPGARAEPGEPTCVQAAVPPPPRGEARRAGSTLWGGAAQQMHTRSLSDLHMERRHLSPSPTPAPTRHVARELPAPPQLPGSTAHSHSCDHGCGSAQGRSRGSLGAQLSSLLWERRGPSQK